MSADDNDEDILKGVSNVVEESTDTKEEHSRASEQLEESQDNTEERQDINEFVSQEESLQDGDGKKSIIEEASKAIMNKHKFLTIEERVTTYRQVQQRIPLCRSSQSKISSKLILIKADKRCLTIHLNKVLLLLVLNVRLNMICIIAGYTQMLKILT